MSTLTFPITFASRSDATPTDNGYTYHHILPWRYYYAMGVVLAQVARLYLLAPSAYGAKSRYDAGALDAEKSKLNDSKKMALAYGTKYEVFKSAIAGEIKGMNLLDLCRDLHGVGTGVNNAINVSLTTANGFDFGAIGNICGAPRFGGFLGMAPEQRSDDMGDAPERNRPFSVDENHWGCLMLLATHLKAFCPELVGAKAGSEIIATVDAKTFELFIANLNTLVRAYNANPSPFDPSDWVTTSPATNWEYVTNARGIDMAKTGKLAKVMRLRTRPTDPAGSTVARPEDATTKYRICSPNNNDRKNLYWIND